MLAHAGGASGVQHACMVHSDEQCHAVLQAMECRLLSPPSTPAQQQTPGKRREKRRSPRQPTIFLGRPMRSIANHGIPCQSRPVTCPLVVVRFMHHCCLQYIFVCVWRTCMRTCVCVRARLWERVAQRGQPGACSLANLRPWWVVVAHRPALAQSPCTVCGPPLDPPPLQVLQT
jgi:hypothetical protein